jgi:hypothetical protein
MRDTWQAWYENDANRQRHIRGVAQRRRRRIARLRELVHEAKDRPCMDCQQQFDVEAMDLDHLDEKRAALSRLIYTSGEDAVRAELAKCEAVCANCHRVRTKRRREEGGAASR